MASAADLVGSNRAEVMAGGDGVIRGAPESYQNSNTVDFTVTNCFLKI